MSNFKIAMIPDVQAKSNVDLSHLPRIGKYLVKKKPDVIVQIGDFADMESLSSYDVGKRQFEGRTYKKDIRAAHKAMRMLMHPIRMEQERLIRNKEKRWNPRFVLTLGNHENRINRAIDYDRKLEDLISVDDLHYKQFGWEVYDYLEVVVIGGIAFSHFFVSGIMGRPITTANALLTKKHMSCVAGHQQGRQIAYAHRADGREMTGLIAGSCYLHDEEYLGVQGNQHFRGFYMLHEVTDGSFDEMAVSLNYLERRFG